MSSIRNATLAALAMAIGFTVGCQRPDYSGSRAALSPTPIQEDPAMQLRQWSAVSATYPNGSVPAGPTGMFRTPRRGMDEWKYYYADTGAFLLNVVALPYELWRTPVSKEVIYPGEVVEPTYTAVPPVPAELRPDLPAPTEPAPAVSEPAPAVSEPAPAASETPLTPEEPATMPAAGPTTKPATQP